MKDSTKHILCAATFIIVFVLGACHKDSPSAARINNTSTDSLHRADSLRRADSLSHDDTLIYIRAMQQVGSVHIVSFQHFIDSLRGADSLSTARRLRNRAILDSAVGTYYCSRWTHGYSHLSNLETFIGYDTIKVMRAIDSNTVIINGFAIPLDTVSGRFSEPMLADSAGYSTHRLSFANNFNVINYEQDHYYNIFLVFTGYDRYQGSKIH